MSDLPQSRLNALCRKFLQQIREPASRVPALDLLLWGLEHPKRVPLPHHETRFSYLLLQQAQMMQDWAPENVMRMLLNQESGESPGAQEDELADQFLRATPESAAQALAENLLSSLVRLGVASLS